jgi:hypothetical protein
MDALLRQPERKQDTPTLLKTLALSIMARQQTLLGSKFGMVKRCNRRQDTPRTRQDTWCQV